MAKGEKNAYTCEECGGIVVTIDRDDGATPMFMSCRATEDCPGTMQSAWYMIVPSIAPTFEWRKPTATEYRKLSSVMKDHVDMGGLDIYPI